MKFVKKILKKRANSGSIIGAGYSYSRTSKVSGAVDTKEIVSWVLIHECRSIIERGIYTDDFTIRFGRELQEKKKAANKGEYIRQLYADQVKNRTI
jgi:hypothetical protein